VSLAVPGQEGDAHPTQPPDGDFVTRIAEWRVYLNFLNTRHPLDVI
jgi:hypothetical protein